MSDVDFPVHAALDQCAEENSILTESYERACRELEDLRFKLQNACAAEMDRQAANARSYMRQLAESRVELEEMTKARDWWSLQTDQASDGWVEADRQLDDAKARIAELAAALNEACDLFYTTPEQIAAGFDPGARIIALRKIGAP